MNYIDINKDQSRVASIFLVVLLHLLLGYAFVSGLAYKVVRAVSEDLKTFNVEEPPAPAAETPPAEPEAPAEDTPVVATKSLVKTNVQQSPVRATSNAAPSRSFGLATSARLISGQFNNDRDYPSTAMRNEEQGTVRVTYTIGLDGRVSNCRVVGSSGSRALDATTCRILENRFRYSPAVDSNGHPMAETRTQPVTWRLE